MGPVIAAIICCFAVFDGVASASTSSARPNIPAMMPSLVDTFLMGLYGFSAATPAPFVSAVTAGS